MSNPGTNCQHCGYRALVPTGECPRCRRPYSATILQPTLVQNSTMQIPAAVPPAASPPNAALAAYPQPGEPSHGWQMVHAIQSGILILLLAAAVFLLYRHEVWLQENGQSGSAPGAGVSDFQHSINVEVNHPIVTVSETDPLPHSPTVHTGPTGRSMRVGRTISLSSFITDRNFDRIPLGRLRWNSQNSDVATVDGYGNVTACSPGVAAITVTDTETNASGTISIQVEPVVGPTGSFGQQQIRFSAIPQSPVRNVVLDNGLTVVDPNRTMSQMSQPLIPKGPEWKPSPDLLRQLGPEVQMDGYAMRVPQSYEAVDVSSIQDAKGTFVWRQRQSQGPTGALMTAMVVSNAGASRGGDPRQEFLKGVTRGQARQMSNLQAGPVEEGQIGGIAFLRQLWSGQMPSIGAVVHGVTLVGADQFSVVAVSGFAGPIDDAVQVPLIETAAASIHRINP